MYLCAGWWTWPQTTRGQRHTNYGWLQRRREQNCQRVSSLNWEWLLNLVSASTACLCKSVILVAKMRDPSLKTKLNHHRLRGSALLQNGFLLTFHPVVMLYFFANALISQLMTKNSTRQMGLPREWRLVVSCVVMRTFFPKDMPKHNTNKSKS